jgi:hypothetical protein
VGSCDNLRINTLLIYFECTEKESVCDTVSNIPVLNTGSEPIIRLYFDFVLKFGCVPPVSTIGIGMGSRFCFRFLRMVLMQTKLSPFIMVMIFTV